MTAHTAAGKLQGLDEDAYWYEAAQVVGVTNALNVVADAGLGTPGLNAVLTPPDEATAGPEVADLFADIRAFYASAELPGPLRLAARDPGYLTDLADKLGDLIRQAHVALRSASIVYGTGRCDLATNRDYFDAARGEYVCGHNPEGVADDTVLVAKVVDDAGAALATIVNYACHPTTLAWENTLISPDYVGAIREVVETATRAPCIFIQGASGDIGPRTVLSEDPLKGRLTINGFGRLVS